LQPRRSDGVTISAIYELPVPIWISTDVLGERIRTGLGPLTFDVPRLTTTITWTWTCPT